MTRRLPGLFLLISTSLILVSGISSANEPENLHLAKQAAIFYHDSGEYDYDLGVVAQKAQDYLEKRISENNKLKNKKRLAVVLDIDETSLSNYRHLLALDFGIIPEIYKETIMEAVDPVIPGTLELYKYAKLNGVAVFFITGRTEDLKVATIKNLNNAGYKDWNGLFFKPSSYQQTSIIPYKSSIRKRIQESGYDIVLNIGDQYSDLAGGYSERSFKLPNPYYYIP
ncbi:MAG TPA: HAD family acid phosphatase [Thermodesulfobacteriota bacterium]|nr:HAD family acid phosphatase [Thermodesulfobacteriota bacterium]